MTTHDLAKYLLSHDKLPVCNEMTVEELTSLDKRMLMRGLIPLLNTRTQNVLRVSSRYNLMNIPINMFLKRYSKLNFKKLRNAGSFVIHDLDQALTRMGYYWK